MVNAVPASPWFNFIISKKSKILIAMVLLGSFVLLYGHVIAGLIQDWALDENYSHGFLIVPLSLVFTWERRKKLASAQPRPSLLGLVLITGSLLMLAAGILGVEYFLTRISMLGVLAGMILFVYGWQHLRIMVFPILFLLLMMIRKSGIQ